MMGCESKEQANHSTKSDRAFRKQLIKRFSNAMAIAIRRRISDIGIVAPGFKTVEARLRAAQGRIFFFGTTGSTYYVCDLSNRKTFTYVECM